MAPAVARNRAAIAEVLHTWLPHRARVLEIASGSGEHAVYFCGARPDLVWQPSDRDAAALASISAWRETSAIANMLPPILLDVTGVFPSITVDAVIALNMIHIAPWAATLGLLAGAARVLPRGGTLYVYGPYFEAETISAPSNLAFDADLRARSPDWGIRDVAALKAAATAAGFTFAARVAMPANNLSLIFRKS